MSSMLQLGAGQGVTVTALGSTYVTKTDGSHVLGAYSLLEEAFWADDTPLHRHVGAEESFYVLSGEIEVWTEDSVSQASAGAFIVVPRGAAHALRRLSSKPVSMLTIVSPPGFEAIFRAVADEGEEQLLADPQRLVDLAARYGTEVLGDYPS